MEDIVEERCGTTRSTTPAGLQSPRRRAFDKWWGIHALLPGQTGRVLSSAEPHVCAPIEANGNLTSDGTKTYFWNALNQLVEVREGTTTLATFEYDGEGRRTEKVAAGITHQYVYDAEDVVEERVSGTSSDTIRYHHGIGIDEPLARTNASSVTTYY
ncbi:MAG: hypothetical protein ACRD1W_06685, partial [Vicinamibacterales bacterium]